MGNRSHTFLTSRVLLVLAPLCMLPRMSGATKADDAARFTILEENDSLFFNSDKHYTQGLRLSAMSPAGGVQV